MPLIETRGAASAQGFGEFAQSAAVNYIEDVFSTYVYTGSGTSKTITNGIDLSGKGGLVWTKMRSSPVSNAHNHRLSDSAIGVNQVLSSNNTDPKTSSASFGISSFNSDGYTITNPGSNGGWNHTNDTFVSWTFRKQAKFFDVVTYTGTGVARNVSHNLGSVPGCIIVKRTDLSYGWFVRHRSLSSNAYLLRLDGTGAEANGGFIWNNQAPTSTTFPLGTDIEVNANGGTYVAYLFAHNAGGFGLSGSDNVISCGSFTTDGSGNATVSLGYEPQWFLLKQSTGSTASWVIVDSMRGFVSGPATTTSDDATLNPNNANAEGTNNVGRPTATGFEYGGSVASQTFIYIAIRRGPMKTPTSGTSVFSPNTSSGTGGTVITTGFPLDAMLEIYRSGGYGNVLLDRLRGIVTIPYGTGAASAYLTTNTTGAEQSLNNYSAGVNNTGFQIPSTYDSLSTIYYSFRRAPGFFDVVCYTGTGSSQNITHNLGVAPELIICKARTDPGGLTPQWTVGFSFNSTNFSYAYLNLTAAATTPGSYTGQSTFSAQPTSTQFTVNTYAGVNQNGAAMIAYLFATVAGVSKVGTYTGSGTTKQIDCGFTGGARFVLIKRTDSTGDWYVWDTARGIVAGNDPYLRLNSTVAEVTNTDYIDTYSAGFELSSTAPAALNANGGSYIFLAIA